MRVGFYDHRGYGTPYAHALRDAGHEIDSHGPGDVLLIDCEAPFVHEARMAEAPRIVTYPHGANNPPPAYEPNPKTIGRIYIAPGYADAHESAGDTLPKIVAGWTFCEQLPFRQTSGARILVAPEHPIDDGWLGEGRAEANEQMIATARELSPLALVHHGPCPPHEVIDLIDKADVVVAGMGTFPHLAIARGCPTVIYGQDLSHVEKSPDGVLSARFTDEAWAAVRYPYEGLDGPLDETIVAACSIEQTRWREQFIGTPFDPAGFVEAFEALCA